LYLQFTLYDMIQNDLQIFNVHQKLRGCQFGGLTHAMKTKN